LNKLLGAADADVAAADAASALADAAGEAAGAVAAVVVAVAAAAAGDVAAGRRRDFLNCRHSAGFAPTGRDCASGYSRADVCDRAPQSKRPIPRLTRAAGSGALWHQNQSVYFRKLAGAKSVLAPGEHRVGWQPAIRNKQSSPHQMRPCMRPSVPKHVA
jgi:hypothetical protein